MIAYGLSEFFFREVHEGCLPHEKTNKIDSAPPRKMSQMEQYLFTNPKKPPK